MILGIVLQASDHPLVAEKRIVNLCITQIRVGGFNEGCEVEACAKYNVANNTDFTFCFNSLVERGISLICS